jgi:hypothetical protein
VERGNRTASAKFTSIGWSYRSVSRFFDSS